MASKPADENLILGSDPVLEESSIVSSIGSRQNGSLKPSRKKDGVDHWLKVCYL